MCISCALNYSFFSFSFPPCLLVVRMNFLVQEIICNDEVELLVKIDHLNLMKLLGFTDKEHEHVMITEYVTISELLTLGW